MKIMKLKVIVGIIMVSGLITEAQTNIPFTIRTNFVTAASWFREVDGQLYNTEYSRKFEPIYGEIMAVSDDKIVVQKYTSVPVSWGQNEYGQKVVLASEKVYDIKYVVQNYPIKNKAVGETIALRAMQIGTTNLDGETLELWDFGKPHIVMIVTTNYPHTFTANKL